MHKFFKAIAKVFFFTILFCSSVYAENITGSGNEVAENTDEQQNIAGDDTDVTVKSSLGALFQCFIACQKRGYFYSNSLSTIISI